MIDILQLAQTAGLITVTQQINYVYSIADVEQMIRDAANEVHIDAELLLRQCHVESDTERRPLDYIAVGDDGNAIGLGQIWLRYARWYITTFWPDAPVVKAISVNELSDADIITFLLHPENAARLVAHIMAARLRTHSWPEAICIYNMGPGAWKALVAEHGPAALAYVPRRTAKYIMRVLWDSK